MKQQQKFEFVHKTHRILIVSNIKQLNEWQNSHLRILYMFSFKKYDLDTFAPI